MIEKYEKACKIAFEVLQETKSLIRPGAKLLEIAEAAEAKIREKGAKPAFPANISINEVAAHFTPEDDSTAVLGEKDIVKLDVGVHVDGFIGDNALTVDLSNENGKLVEAAEKALDAAICTIRSGVKIGDVGAEVEAAIKGYGYKPIENLTGHSLGEYELHAGVEIPNIGNKDPTQLSEGMVIAIEPFATNGEGRVSESPDVEIFSFSEKIPVRMRESRRLLNYAEENFRTLPFAERWLYKDFHSKLLLHAALKELVFSTALKQYPILKESGKGLVSQAEVTVVVEKDAARVLTK
ncbi:MAG: type II methionyl aminopeptidase [Candidatus Micrarchaeota archaeon]|nr:type II methionyl aminopeptidase [Candidatus Micrarchaeota archaeon]